MFPDHRYFPVWSTDIANPALWSYPVVLGPTHHAAAFPHSMSRATKPEQSQPVTSTQGPGLDRVTVPVLRD